ncbi:MAG: EAL domain-containing protein [Rhodoferax sp.]|nr:EAL domain-containing protein [Rhodoferax sp.]
MPTEARYTPIIDAIQGNYAFLWDHKSRAISHPRDYFIVGYNADTGLPETPWMDQSLYEAWKASGQSSSEFLAQTPPFLEPSLKKKPAQALVKAGTIALDCRYLNFGPQCQGFDQLTRDGGSGSFVIFFSGLWKLTTAAAIPYHTGQYANDPRGFGFVTIGANVADFHQAATASGQRIAGVIAQQDKEFALQRVALVEAIQDNLSHTAGGLIVSTSVLVVLVILIAIWMADVLTRRITSIVEGIRRFQDGDHSSRLVVKSRDEMGLLAASFNGMADAVQDAFARMSTELEMRRQAEQQLLIAAAAFDSQEAICVTDANSLILRVNQAFVELSGYSAGELVGQNPRILQSGRHDAAFYAAMWQRIAESGFWEGEIWDKRKNGEVYPKWLTITAIKSADGTVSNYVATQTDITARKVAEDEIKYLAFYDSLTGLPNRRLLMDRLRKALATSTRSGKHGALLFVDMDNFKVLNDTLGHHMGDLLLKQVAQRLVSCVREIDTVARLGGDEFVVMLEDLSPSANDAASQTEIVGNKVLATLEPIYRIETHDYRITPSMGATLFVGHQQTLDELLKKADIAMYQAKAAGRNTIRFYDPEMQAAVTRRATLEADLRGAVADGQLLLHYQVQVDDAGRLTGAEVLVRWQHPQRGLVSPAEFIPLAEETGLILPVGYWVLETACAQLAAWESSDLAHFAHFSLAVNVSAQQFLHPDFVTQVLAVLDKTGADPRKLKLELTESLFLNNVEGTIDKMTTLKARGVTFSLDDFGTGYSSLNYLKRLPLDQLKIDQSFVRDVFTSANDAAIVRTIVALARSLGLAVIAEGVETEEQKQFLASADCRAFQGYLFSRPLPLAAFEQFLAQNPVA